VFYFWLHYERIGSLILLFLWVIVSFLRLSIPILIVSILLVLWNMFFMYVIVAPVFEGYTPFLTGGRLFAILCFFVGIFGLGKTILEFMRRKHHGTQT